MPVATTWRPLRPWGGGLLSSECSELPLSCCHGSPHLLSLPVVAAAPVVQIGLFAVPFVTVVGWVLGHPFSLGFDPFAALVLLLSVMHAALMINDGESHW